MTHRTRPRAVEDIVIDINHHDNANGKQAKE
jgi:hypothetical protein